ncbi:MAG: DUF3109 family protein, partial [Bacteroidota bacterium]
MLIIQGKLVDQDIIASHFQCNLDACKGACCVEGDYGAPLADEEIQILEEIYPKIKSYLTQEGKAAIKEQGTSVYFKEPKEFGTPLVDGKACAYLTYTKNGIALCGIEKAYRDGIIDFKKPVSCELYPIRVNINASNGFEHLEYDRWDICNPACKMGAKKQVRL